MDGKNSESDRLRKLVPRGFLESYILSFLREEPIHGYAVIQKVKEKTGFWKPSPGTVYPVLHSLVRKGFIKEIKEGRRKKYMLTKKGLKIAKEVKDLELKMREKTSEILGEILNIDKEELKRFFEHLQRKYKTAPLSFQLHKMFTLLFRLSQEPAKWIKAEEVIRETNTKLKELLGRKG